MMLSLIVGYCNVDCVVYVILSICMSLCMLIDESFALNKLTVIPQKLSPENCKFHCIHSHFKITSLHNNNNYICMY